MSENNQNKNNDNKSGNDGANALNQVPQATPVQAPRPATAASQTDAAKAPSKDQPLSPEKREQLSKLRIPGVEDKPLNNLAYSDEALLTKEKLAKEEKVSLFIPFDGGEKRGSYRSVIINGYRIEVAKGKQMKLPKSVAALLMDAYSIEADTLNNNPTNLQNADDEKKRALGL